MYPSPSVGGRTHPGRISGPPHGLDRKEGFRRQWVLTSREMEVLAAMASGKTNTAIAGELFISRKAVEKHVNSIFSKLLLPSAEHEHPRVRAVLMYLGHAQAGEADTCVEPGRGVPAIRAGEPSPGSFGPAHPLLSYWLAAHRRDKA